MGKIIYTPEQRRSRNLARQREKISVKAKIAIRMMLTALNKFDWSALDDQTDLTFTLNDISDIRVALEALTEVLRIP